MFLTGADCGRFGLPWASFLAWSLTTPPSRSSGGGCRVDWGTPSRLISRFVLSGSRAKKFSCSSEKGCQKSPVLELFGFQIHRIITGLFFRHFGKNSIGLKCKKLDILQKLDLKSSKTRLEILKNSIYRNFQSPKIS